MLQEILDDTHSFVGFLGSSGPSRHLHALKVQVTTGKTFWHFNLEIVILEHLTVHDLGNVSVSNTIDSAEGLFHLERVVTIVFGHIEFHDPIILKQKLN